MSSNKISLKVSDRYNIVKYAYQLPCTLAVRLAFDGFVDSISVSSDEEKKAEVQIVNGNPVIGNDFAKEYDVESFQPVILDAIKDYIERLKISAKSQNTSVFADTLAAVESSLGILVK